MITGGLVVDIDDTLADTAKTCFQLVYDQFGDLTEMALPDLMTRYQQPGSVPAWQTSSVQTLIRDTLEDQSWLRQLPPIESAARELQQLQAELPVSLYLSSRLSHHLAATQEWLRAHGFPQAPVKLRTKDLTSPDWKLAFLAAEYPQSYGLIDNELGFLPLEKYEYQGRLIWFNRYQAPTTHTHLWQFSDWSEIGPILKS